MAKVLITGGTGFIGHWLEQIQIEKFDQIVFLNRENYDLVDVAAYWDYIIHLAPVPVDRVINCARWSHATVLLASSGGVYDKEPSDYMKMKMEDEKKLLASGLDVRIARIFTTCGAHMDWKRYAIGQIIRAAIEGGPVNVNPNATRSYMYGTDLAEWLWTILLKGEPGGIYNVGSERPIDLYRLARMVIKDTHSNAEIWSSGVYDPHIRYIPDTKNTREELGLTIKVDLEEAIHKTVEDYKREHI